MLKYTRVWAAAALITAGGLSVPTDSKAEEEAPVFSGYVDTAVFGTLHDMESRDNRTDFYADAKIYADKAWDDVETHAGIYFSSGGGTATLQTANAVVNNMLMDGMSLTVGKFEAPIGFELVDAPDLWQYSHANLYTYGILTYMTGAMVSYGLTDDVSLSIYGGRGMDQDAETNKSKTLGLHVGYTMNDAELIGLSIVRGPEREYDDAHATTMIDVNGEYGTGDLTLGYEVLIGMEEGWIQETPGSDGGTPNNPADDTAGVAVEDGVSWSGALLMANYAFSDKFSLTFRFDYFADAFGARGVDGNDGTVAADGTPFVDADGAAITKNGQALDLIGTKDYAGATSFMTFTLAPLVVLAEGTGIVFEYRHSIADEDVYVINDSGDTTNTSQSWAIEFIHSF